MGDSTTQLSLSASQVAAQFSSLQAMTTPFSIAVSDTAANLAANLTDIEFFAQAGELSSVTLTDGGTPVLSLTAAQVLADATALKAINGSYRIALPSGSTLAIPLESFFQFPTAVLAALSGSYQIDLTEAGYSLPTLYQIYPANSANFDFLSRTILVFNAAQAAASSYALLGYGEAGSRPGALELLDSAANFSANITALSSNYDINRIVLTDGGTPALHLSGAQWSAATHLLDIISGTYSVVLTDPGTPTLSLNVAGNPSFDLSLVNHISGSYNLALTAVPAASALADAQLPHVTSVSVVLFDLNHLDDLQTVAAEGLLGTVQASLGLIGISLSQWKADSTAISHFTGDFSFYITGVSVADAAQISAQPFATHIGISDTGANIVANLAFIESLAASGALLHGIVSDDATLVLSAAQAISAGTLFEQTFGETSSDQVAVALADSAANIVANLAALYGPGAPVIPFSSITLTDGGTPTLTVTAQEVSNDTRVLPNITSSHRLVLSDSSINLVDYLNSVDYRAAADGLTSIILTDGVSVLTLSADQASQGTHVLPLIAGSPELLVSDTADEVGRDLVALESIAKQAHLSITLTDAATPVLYTVKAKLLATYHALDDIQSNYQLVVPDLTADSPFSLTGDQLAGVFGPLGHDQDAFSLSVSGSTTAAAASAALLSHMISPVSIDDTAQAVSAALDTLQLYAVAQKLSGIAVNDNGVIAVSAAQWAQDAAAIHDLSGNFSLLVGAPHSSGVFSGLAGKATTVEFTGTSGQYQITPSSGGVDVSDGGVTVHLTQVTALQFSDSTDIVASRSPPATGAVSSAQVTEMYGAVFGRMPDAGGLAFYEAFAAANPSTPFAQYAQWFLSSSEYTGNLVHAYAQTVSGDQQFITDSYQNLLHRTPSASEVAFYEDKVIAPMVSGLTAGTAAYAAADLQAHALTLVYFSQSPEFLGDVQITAQNPSNAQHWLLLI